jgi:hypothetical protein
VKGKKGLKSLKGVKGVKRGKGGFQISDCRGLRPRDDILKMTVYLVKMNWG